MEHCSLAELIGREAEKQRRERKRGEERGERQRDREKERQRSREAEGGVSERVCLSLASCPPLPPQPRRISLINFNHRNFLPGHCQPIFDQHPNIVLVSVSCHTSTCSVRSSTFYSVSVSKPNPVWKFRYFQVPIFRGSFWVFDLRWRVQNLVFSSPTDMTDQGNQLKQVSQCKKCS